MGNADPPRLFEACLAFIRGNKSRHIFGRLRQPPPPNPDIVLAAAPGQGRTLEALERKMRTYETNIFFLKEFVETKRREIDYHSLRGECMSYVKDLNDVIKRKGETDGFITAY